MNPVEKYIVSKGGYVENDDLLGGLIRLLNKENDTLVTPSMLRGVTMIDLAQVDLVDVQCHESRVERVEPREVPEGGFAGVLLSRSRGYWLIDGYHRLKFLRAAGVDSAPYLVIL